MEELGYLDGQLVAYSTEYFNTNRSIVFTDGTTLLSTDGLTIGEMGLSLVNIPIQIVQDPPIQQQVLTTEIVPENTTIYIDQSQLTYLPNGQVVITEEGLVNTLTEQPVAKQNLFFTPSTSTEAIKPVGELNSLDLTCLDGEEDPLFEEAVGLDEQRLTPTDQQPSPNGEELVISGAEVTWKKDLSTSSIKPTSPPKDVVNDIPPPLRKGPFKCEICFKEFPQYSQFRKHRQFHLEDKPHKCPSCPASYNNPHNLTLHKATHGDSLTCPECSRTFSRVASFKSHVNIHEREESLFCTECGDEFSNQVQLDKHMQSHDEEWVKPAAPIYQCSTCDKQYSRASVLRQHMKDHFKVKAAMSANSYKRAVRKGRMLHSCSVCGKNFQKPSQLTRHTRIHTGEKPFKCDMCPRSFNQKGSLLIHMMSKHKGMRPYQCQFCSAAFSQKGNLRSHVVRLHSIPKTEETVYQCSECSCVFRKLGSLNAHHNRMHPNVEMTQDAKKVIDHQQKKSLRAKDTSDKENDVMEEDEDDPVVPKKDEPSIEARQRITTITITNKMDDGTLKHITMKQRQVGSIKWHQCSYCGKEFKKPSDLVRHTRIHTQERPYKCKHCMRGFSVRSTLMTHIKTHTTTHKCNVCAKVYTSAMLLKHHKRTHHPTKSKKVFVPQQAGITLEAGTVLPEAYTQPLVITDQGVMQVVSVNKVWYDGDRPYKCSICDQAFRKNSSLKAHMRNHLGDRPYTCNLCPGTFKSSGVLKRHMRTHTMLKTHRCNECGKFLSTKSSLQRHMEVHMTGHPFVCPYCPRNFKTQGSCRKHIKTHKLIVTQVVEGENQEMFEVQQVLEGDREDLIQVQRLEESSLPTIPDLDLDPGGEGEGEEELQPSVEEVDLEGEARVSVANIQSLPNIEALIVNRANMNYEPNTILSSEEPYIISTVEGDGRTVASHTLHADASGTITLPNLAGQDTLTQESIREIEESLNQQLFCTTDMNLDKDQVVLFDQGFESCVFPSITLQGEQLELGPALTATSLASIINNSRKLLKTFRCEECGSQHKSSSELETHRLSHLPKDDSVQPQAITLTDTTIQFEDTNLESMEVDNHPNYSCNVCNYIAKSEEDLAKHRESHSTCDICEKSFPTLAGYKTHIRSHGREKEFECELCGSSFTQHNSLTRHMAIHNPSNKTFSCQVCGHQNRSEAQLRRHMSMEHREGGRGRSRSRRQRGEVRQLTEEEAQELANQEATSMSERVLKASLAEKDRISDVKDPDVVRNEPQFANQCKYCPKSFRKPSDLVRHLRIHTGERPFQCDFCSKCFTVKSTLDSHLKTHNAQKRCACHICGYFFATKGSLKVHMRLHTGSRPFRCPVCFQRFRTSGHRKAHLMLHVREAQPQLVQSAMTGDQPHDDTDKETPTTISLQLDTSHPPYVCHLCNKTFSKMCYLTRHIRTHTGEKPFQCKVCEKRFTQKNSLDTHMQLHAGHRPWLCGECGVKFAQKCNLTAHVKRHHTRQPPLPYTIDLSEEKFPVDLEKVVSDLFPHMKPNKNTLGTDEI